MDDPERIASGRIDSGSPERGRSHALESRLSTITSYTNAALVKAPWLAPVDWTRPWLEPFLPVAREVLGAEDWVQGCNQSACTRLLANHHGFALSFVPQADLPRDCGYETFVSQTGQIPTQLAVMCELTASQIAVAIRKGE